MQVITLKLSELTKPERNVRIHTDQQLKEFERSVKMFGQIRPIVVDEKNVILAGNGLYDTLVKMGKETADCYRYDSLTEVQKKKLMIADNKIFSLGIENLDTLNHFLEEMQGDLDIPGFDEDILKQMVSDADEITEKIAEYGTMDDAEIESMKAVGKRREEQMQRMQESQTEPNMPQFGSSEPIQPVQVQNTTTDEDNGAPADVQKFVICPKCGEKIWL